MIVLVDHWVGRCETYHEASWQPPAGHRSDQVCRRPLLSTPHRMNLRRSSAECTTFPAEIPTVRQAETRPRCCLLDLCQASSNVRLNTAVPTAVTCSVETVVDLPPNWRSLLLLTIPEGRHVRQLTAAPRQQACQVAAGSSNLAHDTGYSINSLPHCIQWNDIYLFSCTVLTNINKYEWKFHTKQI